MEILSFIKQIGIIGLIDIIFMAFLIYAILVLFKKKRTTFILTGILISAFLYFVAYQLNLVLMTTVLRGFFAVILIAMIVMFRDELRDLFEEMAVWSMRRRTKHKKRGGFSRKEVQILIRTLSDLAREKIGALIVVKGKQSILRHLEGGTTLNGELSDPLLKSLFDPHSIGHDGAVLLEGGLVAQFGAHLPLSNNFEQLTRGGTRHAAALGLSEVSDSLCLIVSEERGVISVTQEGRLKEIKQNKELEKILDKHFEKISPQNKPSLIKDFFKKNYKEKIIAVLLAASMWFFFVHEAALVYRSFKIEITYPQLNQDLQIEKIIPEKTELVFSGPRNAFHFVGKKDIRIILPLGEANVGNKRIGLTESNITFPKSLILETIQPKYIDVTIEKKKKEPPKP